MASNYNQLDMFAIDQEDNELQRLKDRSKEVLAAIKRIDPDINVVAIFCDIIHSFIVEENGKFNLYIFNDAQKLDSFRFDNWSFKDIPDREEWIKVKEVGK